MQNLYFSTALVNRVHDTGHIIEMMSKRNFALRNEVLEMKSSVNLDSVAAAEKRVANLEVEVKRLREHPTLAGRRNVQTSQGYRGTANQGSIDSIECKVSQCFKLSMERIECVTY
ncbi:hypothetical protein BHM03_00000570 [Ensete ventricosum]|nr:hypothetical protein BHM03_00000570 [Ensete ventricosum]